MLAVVLKEFVAVVVFCVLLARTSVWPGASLLNYALWAAFDFPMLNSYLGVFLTVAPAPTQPVRWVRAAILTAAQIVGVAVAAYARHMWYVGYGGTPPRPLPPPPGPWLVFDEALGVLVLLLGAAYIVDLKPAMDYTVTPVTMLGLALFAASLDYVFAEADLNLIDTLLTSLLHSFDPSRALVFSGESALRCLGGVFGLALALVVRYFSSSPKEPPLRATRIDEAPPVDNVFRNMFVMEGGKFKGRV